MLILLDKLSHVHHPLIHFYFHVPAEAMMSFLMLLMKVYFTLEMESYVGVQCSMTTIEDEGREQIVSL